MDTLRDVMEAAFFDELEKIEQHEMEKEAQAWGQLAKGLWAGAKATAPTLARGGNWGQFAKYMGTRAGIGAAAGGLAGGATSREGQTGRGVLRGALLGGTIGAGVGGAQLGTAAARVARHGALGTAGVRQAARAAGGSGRQAMRQYGAASRTLQSAGVDPRALKQFHTAWTPGTGAASQAMAKTMVR